MAVDPRRRRRKTDPDHAKRKRIKKAIRTAGSALIPGGGGAAEALEGALKKSRYGKRARKPAEDKAPARKPRGRAKGTSPQGLTESNMDSRLYGDWMQQESPAVGSDPRTNMAKRAKRAKPVRDRPVRDKGRQVKQDPRRRGGDRTKLIYKDEMPKRKRRKIEYKTPPE